MTASSTRQAGPLPIPDTRSARPVPSVAAGGLWWTREWAFYCGGAVLTLLVTGFMLRLWRAVWTVPFFYTGDAVGSAAHVKATLEWGWYEYQPDLGAPYGQHYNDFPFSDNLHLLLLKAFAPLSATSWPVAFNLYYVAGFVGAGVAMMWFLRR